MEVGHTVHQLVDARQGIRIFGTGFVEVGIVCAHVPFLVGLPHHDNVGQPSRVSDFSNKLGFEQLVDLSLTTLRSSSPIFLFFCETGLA